MALLSSDLLDDVLDEIRRREPGYFSLFPVAMPPIDRVVESYRVHPLFRDLPAPTLERVLLEGFAHYRARGVTIVDAAPGVDPVADVLLAGSMDAAAACRNLLALYPLRGERPLPSILAEDYEERATPDGRRYFIRRRGAIPLLLISASGVSLAVWSKLLGDPAHDFRLIVMETRSTDPFRGGMREDADLARDASDFADMLDREALPEVHVLGWCNGGRVAIELVSRQSPRLRSLTLLSPALRRIGGKEAPPTRFEESLDQVFLTVARNAALAQMFVKALRQDSPVNWDALRSDPVKRARTLFGLPPQDRAAALSAPLSQPESLVHYGRRMISDKSHAIDDALSRISLPVLLITGAFDAVVNNAFAVDGLGAFLPGLRRARIDGAGHHSHDLQYPYLRWLLESFVGRAEEPKPTARVDVAP